MIVTFSGRDAELVLRLKAEHEARVAAERAASAEQASADLEGRILAAMPRRSKRDIVATVGGQRARVLHALDALIARGLVVTLDGGGYAAAGTQ